MSFSSPLARATIAIRPSSPDQKIRRRKSMLPGTWMVMAVATSLSLTAGLVYWHNISPTQPALLGEGPDLIRTAVDACHDVSQYKHGTELWGNVVIAPGSKVAQTAPISAKSAVECCKKCSMQRGCNTWVWCSDPAACGRQCMLKRVDHEEAQGKALRKWAGLPWTSGSLFKDLYLDPVVLPPLDASIRQIVLATSVGRINITLMPGWSMPSVAYVQRLAQQPELCTNGCQFYRAEPGFVLSGSLRAYVPSNNQTKQGPRVMEQGDVGWADGGPGPEFFIWMGEQPATHMGKAHTVWGQVSDPDSLAVAQLIIGMNTTSHHPDGAHLLNTFMDFTISGSA